ncbi:MAG TPA: JAB domain-containing protein [Planctomycetota bacterium]|nr:JAB domain-containing protein [Planctomycetota bacterium]
MGTPLTERCTWRRVRLSLVREQADRAYPQPRAVRHGGDIVGLLRSFLGDDPRERFAVVYLDTRHRPIAVHDAHTGTCDSSPVHPREVFGPAVALAATAVVVAHNHPSGDPTPSAGDRAVTERLRQAGELLGIPVLDHLVLGSERFYSFASEGFHVLAGGAP